METWTEVRRVSRLHGILRRFQNWGHLIWVLNKNTSQS